MTASALAESFDELSRHAGAKREPGFQFKIAMYKKASKAIRNARNDINGINDVRTVLKSVFKDPKKILAKADELFATGTMSAANKARADPVTQAIILLSSVPQIGPVKARTLVTKHNITTISQLKQQPGLLHSKQQLGLKYYNALIDPKTLDAFRIPRKEITQLDSVLDKAARAYSTDHAILGS